MIFAALSFSFLGKTLDMYVKKHFKAKGQDPARKVT